MRKPTKKALILAIEWQPSKYIYNVKTNKHLIYKKKTCIYKEKDYKVKRSQSSYTTNLNFIHNINSYVNAQEKKNSVRFSYLAVGLLSIIELQLYYIIYRPTVRLAVLLMEA